MRPGGGRTVAYRSAAPALLPFERAPTLDLGVDCGAIAPQSHQHSFPVGVGWRLAIRCVSSPAARPPVEHARSISEHMPDDPEDDMADVEEEIDEEESELDDAEIDEADFEG